MNTVRRRSGWMVTLVGFLLLITPVSTVAGDISVGGWAGFVYSDSDKSGSIRGFDAHPLYLYVQGEPLEGYRFFGEIEAEHVFRFEAGESGDGELKLERLYIERNFSTRNNVRLGKFFLPFGYWYRLHWHFLTETLSRPISFNNSYTPRFQVGLQYFGRAFLGDTDFKYYAWVGDGPDQYGTNKRAVEDLGYGGSVFITHKIGGEPDLTVGGAVGYHANRVSLEASDVGFHTHEGDLASTEEDQKNLVTSLEARLRRLELRGEFNFHFREVTEDMTTWYINALFWFRPSVGGNYRVDNGEDIKHTRSVSDHDVTSQSIGLVWRPQAQVLFKAEYRFNRFDGTALEDFNEWNGFMALKF